MPLIDAAILETALNVGEDCGIHGGSWQRCGVFAFRMIGEWETDYRETLLEIVEECRS